MMQCNSPAKLITPKFMDHNNFDIFKDIINNLKDFFQIFVEDGFDEIKFLERMSFRNSIKSRGNVCTNPECICLPKILFKFP